MCRAHARGREPAGSKQGARLGHSALGKRGSVNGLGSIIQQYSESQIQDVCIWQCLMPEPHMLSASQAQQMDALTVGGDVGMPRS